MARDVITAISLLPEAYRSALHLQLGGASADDIGRALRMDPAGVPALLAVADAKLRELLIDDQPAVAG